MTTKEEDNQPMIEKPRNFVAKHAHQINKSGKIPSKKDKATQRRPKHKKDENYDDR